MGKFYRHPTESSLRTNYSFKKILSLQVSKLFYERDGRKSMIRKKLCIKCPSFQRRPRKCFAIFVQKYGRHKCDLNG